MANLYRIGEVSKICEIPIKTLRYYEEEKLISPVKVDIYTGYRYYDDNNIEHIYRVKLLKNLGFSIKEIRQFNENSLQIKLEEIQEQFNQLKDRKAMISYLQKQKGEKIMKPFINDENAIGKWTYLASSSSKNEFLQGNYSKEKKFINTLYFLPQGKGYWVFERWTKGEIYHSQGDVYKYEIQDNKLFLNVTFQGEDQGVYVFEKEDSKEYDLDSIKIKDKIDENFKLDKNALGLWVVVDFINIEEKDNYVPKDKSVELYVKSMTINPNGEYIFEVEGELQKDRWTKGKIFDQNDVTASNYIIKEFNGEKYLILDWKSGDYTYQGEIFGCYVFKKF